MFSLLRNKVEAPSYKRGLTLTSAMLIFYGLTFQVFTVESLEPEFLSILKYMLWGIAIVLTFRARAERRALSENNGNYISMMDKSVVSLRWQILAFGMWGLSGAIIHLLFFRNTPFTVSHVIIIGLPFALFVLAAAYANAAKNWTHDSH